MIRRLIFFTLFFLSIEIGFSNTISFSKDGKNEDTIIVNLDEVSNDSVVQVKELVFDNIDSIQSDEILSIDSASARIRFCKPYSFFERSAVLNKPRIGMALGLTGASYIGLNFWWSKAWYSNYEKSKFQLFNDSKEWNQVDKIGHGFSAYLESTWSAQVFEWAGMKPKKAAWLGFGVAQMWQLAIEFQDAFSAKWGFSLSDVAANIGGAGWNLWQEYAWGEQRIWLKESAWPTNYPDSLQGRANSLFGKSFAEGILKDYNSTAFWLSASIGSFIKKSADIDWTRIPTKSKALKTFFSLLNIIKIPFPAIEFNTARQVKWHWLMF